MLVLLELGTVGGCGANADVHHLDTTPISVGLRDDLELNIRSSRSCSAWLSLHYHGVSNLLSKILMCLSSDTSKLHQIDDIPTIMLILHDALWPPLFFQRVIHYDR